MRPLAALNGILLGTATAIFIGTAVTLLVVFLLRGEHPRLSLEMRPLLVATLAFAAVSAASAVALYGELRGRAWRWHAQLALAACLGATLALMWPR
jgi:hypothetical protein